MKKFTKEDQKLLAFWAADCAGHVLPYFEKEFPKDDRLGGFFISCSYLADIV